MTIIFLFLFGLAVGSFLNVLIYRWNVEGSPSPFCGRSFCPVCRKALVWKDLVPVFSFIRLRGRCRFCQAPISRAYPIVELVTAISFVATGVNPFNLIFISTLIVIFFSDWIYGLIPDQTVILLSILGLARYRLDGLAAGVVAASLLAMLIVITRGRGLGWGDVKLSLAMGLLLGPIGLMIALWIGFVSGGLAAVLLLLLRRKKMRDTMALGPYLVVGIWAAYFYGDKISTLARL